MEIIGYIESELADKFGAPRQSMLAPSLKSRLVCVPPFGSREAFRGLEEIRYIWLLWAFEPFEKSGFSPTVRPPKLGGNARIGVFATRSPNRPNGIGLSLARLLSVETKGPKTVLHLAGAELIDGTAVYDIKPYLPYTDAYPVLSGEMSPLEKPIEAPPLEVMGKEKLPESMSPESQKALLELLALDPRPGYQHEEGRLYRMTYGRYDIGFVYQDGKIELRDCEERAPC